MKAPETKIDVLMKRLEKVHQTLYYLETYPGPGLKDVDTSIMSSDDFEELSGYIKDGHILLINALDMVRDHNRRKKQS